LERLGDLLFGRPGEKQIPSRQNRAKG